MTTYISPNIKKVSERIDPDGNIINPSTKQVIKQNTPEYVPTPQEQAFVQPQVVQTTKHETPKSIQEEINATKLKLAELEERKRQKIEEMRRELEELEK